MSQGFCSALFWFYSVTWILESFSSNSWKVFGTVSTKPWGRGKKSEFCSNLVDLPEEEYPMCFEKKKTFPFLVFQIEFTLLDACWKSEINSFFHILSKLALSPGPSTDLLNKVLIETREQEGGRGGQRRRRCKKVSDSQEVLSTVMLLISNSLIISGSVDGNQVYNMSWPG